MSDPSPRSDRADALARARARVAESSAAIASRLSEGDRRSLRASNAAALAARAEYVATLGIWLGDDWSTDVARLSADYPIALLPARIETRFGTRDGAPCLRVRMYPDEISADTHEPELTSDELAAGETYWQAGWDVAGEAEAWRTLRLSFGDARAAWIVRATTPTNLEERPAGAPVFPTVPLKPASWTRPGETRVLPDRWVVVCRRGDRVLRHVGSPIPDPLTLTFSPAIEPDDTDSVTDISGDGLELDKAVSWTVDFAEAEAIGMGVTIPLDATDARQGFDRVLVYGVKSSLEPEVAGQRLESLLDAHHFGRGMAFVPQGTPTNNSADAPSGFPPADPNGAASFAVERGAPLAGAGSIGEAFAKAVGVDVGIVDHLAGAERPEQRSAAAMNRALWPVTGGYFLEQLLEPLVSSETVETSRQHFINWVRGRGPLPAFRVGSTPYGCLPVSSLARWQPSRESNPVGRTLPQLLRQLLPHWMRERAAVPRVGRGDPDQSLIDVLSMDASAREVWVRPLLGGDATENLSDFLGIPWGQRRVRQMALTEVLGDLWTGDTRVPRILTGVFHAQSGRYRYPLVAEVLSETNGLDFNYLTWCRSATIEQLRNQSLPAGTPPQTALLYHLIRHALLREYDKAALDLLIRVGRATAADRREFELVGIVPGTESRKTAWDRLAAPVPGVTGDISLGDHLQRSVQDLRTPASRRLASTVSSRRAIVAPMPETHVLAELYQAIEHLEALPTAELDRLLTETMDTCAHRLDAWITSLASERLADLRVRRPAGAHLGAFAWVEDLRPSDVHRVALQQRNGGFIHAPSMPHAAAAAVLRNAYLTRSGEGRERYALDLSSRRVRRARWLLGAMREGQSLRALLGYQFERGLHERHLEKYIEPLRRLFPLPERDEQPATVAVQGLSPRDVVDGLALRAGAATLPYDTNPDLPPAGVERDGVKAELTELDATFDAVSDLLTADAVYHLVRGTTMGASASLDAQAQGLRPPDPEVVQAPRGGIPLTHRFAIVLGGAPVADPWSEIAETARSSAEPHFDRWLATLLGAATTIRCRVRHPDPTDATQTVEQVVTLDQLALRPTDLLRFTAGATDDATVLETGGASPLLSGSELDRRIVVAAVGWTAPAASYEVVYAPEPDWSASGIRSFPQALELLRVVQQVSRKARALRPADLLPPEIDAAAALADERVAEADERAETALETLVAVRAHLQDELVAPSADLTTLREAVIAGVAYGAGEFPPIPHPDPATERRRLVAIAEGVVAELTRRIDVAQAASTATERMQTLFGRDFLFLPRFTPGIATELQSALDHGPALVSGDDIKHQWLQQVSRVRPALGTWRRLELYARCLGADPGTIDLAQLPHETGARWVGLPFTPDQAPRARKTSLALHRASAPNASEPWVGLMVDEWNEIIPAAEETTGIGFHYDDPGAEAPQGVLLAVPPVPAGSWDAESLEAILNETLDLAQFRGVFSDLGELAQLIPAIYLAANRKNDTITTDLHGALIQQAQIHVGTD